MDMAPAPPTVSYSRTDYNKMVDLINQAVRQISVGDTMAGIMTVGRVMYILEDKQVPPTAPLIHPQITYTPSQSLTTGQSISNLCAQSTMNAVLNTDVVSVTEDDEPEETEHEEALSERFKNLTSEELDKIQRFLKEMGARVSGLYCRIAFMIYRFLFKLRTCNHAQTFYKTYF